ncbi:MAG: hypothetical protein CSA65_01285 [Proteobacteria bacterium]|nr:MAG: hypothetical protein CSB49_00225 [Pseudomonadota bacterium]PIE19722.1 MAG: hypothetical protein CSA65_01285 [Pseudomonadota bacterium]
MKQRIAIAALFGLFIWGGAASAKPKVAVVPLGRGEALVPSADLARALAARLKTQGKVEPKLVYPLPMPLPPTRSSRKAKQLMKKAFDGFQMLEFTKVRKLARKAMKIYKRELKAGAPPDAYIQALHLVAAAEHFDGRESEAFKRMNDALIWRRRPPPKAKFNPAVQALYAKVAGEQQHRGKLKLQITPGALFWLNRRLQGPARGTLEVRAGLYLMRIGRPGYATWHLWLRVRPGQTREVAVELKKGPVPEDPKLTKLRLEANSVPGSTSATLATDQEVDEVLLVKPEDSCSPATCPMRLRWARGKSWKLRKRVVYVDAKAEQAARQALIVLKRKTQPSLVPSPGDAAPKGSRRCMLDSQCYYNERCKSGICQKVTPITSKWWFWTLIGVGVAGVATAIAVPLAAPSGPVIEVR